MNPDTRKFLSTQMMWIGISLAISLALSFLLPFPISLMAIIAVFVSISYLTRRMQMRRMGIRGSISASFLGGSDSSKVNYYCLGCGYKHSESACPRCGSKMRRAGY
jgi:uncharacterized paraquat-inducible protein A